MSTQKIKVEGMTCNHCVMRVEKALKDVNEVNDVRINLNTGEVTVDHDADKDILPALEKAVDNAGYSVA
ncbi:MAG: heavy-metal-associated domain-containing protein [Fidelibacterota bacterium]